MTNRMLAPRTSTASHGSDRTNPRGHPRALCGSDTMKLWGCPRLQIQRHPSWIVHQKRPSDGNQIQRGRRWRCQPWKSCRCISEKDSSASETCAQSHWGKGVPLTLSSVLRLKWTDEGSAVQRCDQKRGEVVQRRGPMRELSYRQCPWDGLG